MSETHTDKELRLRKRYEGIYAQMTDAEILRIFTATEGQTYSAREAGKRRMQDLITAEARKRGLR